MEGTEVPLSPATFQKYSIKYKFSHFFPLFVYRLLCCLYSSKVTIIRGELLIISFLFVHTLKTLKWNYSVKHRGLYAHFFDLFPKIEDLLSLPIFPNQDQVSAYDHTCTSN